MDFIDKQLDAMLRKPETPISDDGFSESVLSRLPGRGHYREKYRKWTLAGAAAMGSLLTLILAPPIETVFKYFEIKSTVQVLVLLIFLFLMVLSVPLAWLLYSRLADSSWKPTFPRTWSLFRGRMPRL
jgi:hypothetical protein